MAEATTRKRPNGRNTSRIIEACPVKEKAQIPNPTIKVRNQRNCLSPRSLTRKIVAQKRVTVATVNHFGPICRTHYNGRWCVRLCLTGPVGLNLTL